MVSNGKLWFELWQETQAINYMGLKQANSLDRLVTACYVEFAFACDIKIMLNPWAYFSFDRHLSLSKQVHNQNMLLSIMGRSIVSPAAGLTSSDDFLVKQCQRPHSVPSSHVNPRWDSICSQRRLHPSQSGVGRDHQKGTEGSTTSLLWTHTSVQTSHPTTSKEPSRGHRRGYPDHCCPYVYSEPVWRALHERPEDPPPPIQLVLTTCC